MGFAAVLIRLLMRLRMLASSSREVFHQRRVLTPAFRTFNMRCKYSNFESCLVPFTLNSRDLLNCTCQFGADAEGKNCSLVWASALEVDSKSPIAGSEHIEGRRWSRYLIYRLFYRYNPIRRTTSRRCCSQLAGEFHDRQIFSKHHVLSGQWMKSFRTYWTSRPSW